MIFWLVARASFHAGRPIPKNMLSVSCAKHQGRQLFSTLRTTRASHRGRLNRLNPLDRQFISPTPLFAELNQADQPNPPLEQPNRGLGSTGSRRARARRRARRRRRRRGRAPSPRLPQRGAAAPASATPAGGRPRRAGSGWGSASPPAPPRTTAAAPPPPLLRSVPLASGVRSCS